MDFVEWLKLQEVGTGTNSVAAFKNIAIGGPVRRQWPWTEQDPFFKLKRLKDDISHKFSNWLHRRQFNEAFPTQATQSVAQTLPQQNQPTIQTSMPMTGSQKPEGIRPTAAIQTTQPVMTFDPSKYKGAYRDNYNRTYQQYVHTRDPRLGATLQAALQGNDQELRNPVPVTNPVSPAVNPNPAMQPNVLTRN